MGSDLLLSFALNECNHQVKQLLKEEEGQRSKTLGTTAEIVRPKIAFLASTSSVRGVIHYLFVVQAKW